VASLMQAGVKGESARIQTRRKSTNGRSWLLGILADNKPSMVQDQIHVCLPLHELAHCLPKCSVLTRGWLQASLCHGYNQNGSICGGVVFAVRSCGDIVLVVPLRFDLAEESPLWFDNNCIQSGNQERVEGAESCQGRAARGTRWWQCQDTLTCYLCPIAKKIIKRLENSEFFPFPPFSLFFSSSFFSLA
jgi:hypothetical protein